MDTRVKKPAQYFLYEHFSAKNKAAALRFIEDDWGKSGGWIRAAVNSTPDGGIFYNGYLPDESNPENTITMLIPPNPDETQMQLLESSILLFQGFADNDAVAQGEVEHFLFISDSLAQRLRDAGWAIAKERVPDADASGAQHG